LIEEPEQPDAPEERLPEQPEEQAEVADTPEPEPQAEEPQAEEPQAEEQQPAEEKPAEEKPAEEEPRPRGERKPKEKAAEVIPGEHLTPDVALGPEGSETDIERLLAAQEAPPVEYAEDSSDAQPEPEQAQPESVARTPVELAAEARYQATGKRKTSVARVILRPGKGEYTINGRALDNYFPRPTLQHTARQPLETAGYQDSMDVVARIHGGGVSAQADALRHGIARALIEVDPQLRTDLKRRGFLTRDARAKERKKAGLKKARKRPQFSKR
jgi:small subunit ribosomal protein S9